MTIFGDATIIVHILGVLMGMVDKGKVSLIMASLHNQADEEEDKLERKKRYKGYKKGFDRSRFKK